MSHPALDQLPPEILLAISDELSGTDKACLSIANKKIRNQLAPRLFRHIKVDCPLSRDSNLRSVIQKYGAHASSVRLNIKFQPNPPNSDFEGSKVDANGGDKQHWYWDEYPPSVWAQDLADVPLVQDLLRFKGMSKCTTLIIHTNGEEDFEIDGGWDENDLADLSIYFCSDLETWEIVEDKEKKYGWRKAWNELWHDVAKYSKTESLELLHFLPIKASCWLEPEWAAFVGRLRNLTIRAYGQDNGAGWAANTLEGFRDFFTDMDSFLFHHATGLEHLCIAGHEDGFLGESVLSFEPYAMPHLKSLRLETMSVTQSLMEFLSGGTPKLESLHLFNVAAWGFDASDFDPSLRDDPTWAEFWKAVREGNPTLEEVVYRYSKRPPLTYNEMMNDDFDPAETDNERQAQIRKMVSDDPNLIIWPYVTSDDKYGDVQDWEETNLECLARGDDNREYKLLMNEIENRKQSTA
ncbi:hypothetical protein FLONG3_11323 [Fusarium longipes]|uniref:F-box domain-containing protein n=1 Tax=Fusarium longipes TaxID=694270 RepID=A0A395RFV2_9HYPO|nr:hypothetical protein FLONG3_11323 [Fusarium longipes]